MANAAPIDPSQSVHEHLLPHIHLVSTHQYPHKPRVDMGEVIEWLMQAPKIARDTAPFYWTYLECPTDGTILLMWQPTARRQSEYASDGYIWPGPERCFRQPAGPNINLDIEVFYQGTGYRPGAQVAAHSRRRFRLVPPRNGGMNVPPFDPNLWVVHYGPSEKAERIPVQQIPITPQIHQSVSSRQQLMQMGKITRKDFMLSDRVNWPRIPLPGRSQSIYGPPMGGRPVPQTMAYPPHGAPAVGAPPKRRLPHGVPVAPHQAQMMVAAPAPAPVEVYDDEEDTMRGDMFDHMTPRDVSISRYKQNHEWLEEILISPYRVDQIAMVDLNLGLKGELAPLTEGIFEAQGVDALDTMPKKPYIGRLDKGLANEFRRRVVAKTEATLAEIAQLKEQHKKMVATFKEKSTLKNAEKDMRMSVESTGPEFWRVEGREEVNDDSDEESAPAPPTVQTKKLEEILAHVETTLGKKPVAVHEVHRIQDGGYQEPAPEPEVAPLPVQQFAPPPNLQAQSEPAAMSRQPSHAGSQGSAVLVGDSDIDMGGTAASMLDQMQTGFSSASASINIPTPQPHMPTIQSGSSTPAPAAAIATPPPPPPPTQTDDVKMSDAEEPKVATTTLDQGADGGEWVVVPKGGVSPGATGADGADADVPASAPTTTTGAPAVADAAEALDLPGENTPGSGAAPTPADGLNFDNNDFSSLGDLDSAGDALAGFENDNAGEDLGELNMDMEDSAFGDAFHAVGQSGGEGDL